MLNQCEYDKNTRVLRLPSDFFGKPQEFYVESHITGRVVKFVTLGEDDPLNCQDRWDGEMCIYRPALNEEKTKVDHFIIYNKC
jgi:hypothetical protein